MKLNKTQRDEIKKQVTKELNQFYGDNKIKFGKYKYIEFEEIPLYYLQWLLRIKPTPTPKRAKNSTYDNNTCLFDD